MILACIAIIGIIVYLLIVSLFSGFFKVATRFDNDDHTIDSEYINNKNVKFEENTYELDGVKNENFIQGA